MPSDSRPDDPRSPAAGSRGWHAVEGPDARTVQVPVVPPAPRRGAKGDRAGAARPTSTAAERRARVQADQRAQAQTRAERQARPSERGGAKTGRVASTPSRGATKAERATPAPTSASTTAPAPRTRAGAHTTAGAPRAGGGPARPAAPRASVPAGQKAPHHHEPSAPAGALANLRARFVRAPAPAEPTEPRPRATSRPARRGPATGGIRIPKGRASSRPGGPTTHARSPEARNRIEPARTRGSWLSAATWRVAVLAGVLVLAAAVVLPSLRSYFRQQEELAALAAEAQSAQVEVEDLRAEAARWDDPAYVVAQARERLAFVFPGEIPYRVIDPETVEGAAEGSPAAAEEATGAEDGVWYTRLWGSIAGAEALVGTDGEAEATQGPEAVPSPAPTASDGD